MTTLYRTPNIIIDQHEWHAIVRNRNGRSSLCYFWRPLSERQYHWSQMAHWKGRKPKRFANHFQRYKLHIQLAMDSEAIRRFAIARLELKQPERERVAA